MCRSVIHRVAILLLLLSATPPLRAQMLGAEDITPVYNLVKTFKKLIPYRDTANHLTAKHVFLNTDYRYVKLSLQYDSDQLITGDTKAWLLDYLVHHSLWSLQPLADHTFDLRVVLSIADKPVSASYTYTTTDLQDALSPPVDLRARTFVQEVVQYLSGRLPIKINDDGETLADCRYSSQALLLTSVYEYPDTLWPLIRQYTTDNPDQVRRTVAGKLLADTSSSLMEALWLGGITYRHCYRNQSRTDSTEMFIAPWMWEVLIDELPLPAVSDTSDAISDTLALLSQIAENGNQECPYPVDSLTTMVGCHFDSVNRVMTYTYTVDELSMLNLENNATAQANLLDAIQQVMLSGDGKSLAELLVNANATLVFQYSSPHSRSPLTFTLTPAQISALLQ